MRVQYTFPGSIEIGLEIHDLDAMNSRGFTVERCGFSGFDSKTWVHLDSPDRKKTIPTVNNALIEQGGDLQIHLSRGFLLPLTIDRSCIVAPDGHVEHFLGTTGLIHVSFAK